MNSGKLILVIGGAASGKSGYAEKLAAEIHADTVRRMTVGRKPVLWYAATMHHDQKDEETTARIKKHRAQRAGKGFFTIEQERNIRGIEIKVRPGDTILLEDLSNLLANEMFPPEEGYSFLAGEETGPDKAAAADRMVTEKMIRPILEMADAGVQIVAVGNRISEDVPGEWDEETGIYMNCLAKIQNELGKAADQIVETVCGIPAVIRADGRSNRFPVNRD